MQRKIQGPLLSFFFIGGAVFWARICKPFKEPRNRFPAWRAGTTQPYLTYQHAKLHRLAESISWNWFLGSLNINRALFCHSTEWLAKLPTLHVVIRAMRVWGNGIRNLLGMKYWTPRRIRISFYVLFLGDYTIHILLPFYSELYNQNGQLGFLKKDG